MEYVSTRSSHAVSSAAEAILNGLAPDGGLYMPSDFASMHIDIKKVLLFSALELSATVIGRVFPDFTSREMRALVERAYQDKFETYDLTPVTRVGDEFVLELFRGPTSAFKDVALSVLPQLISASKEKLGVTDDIVILTATSGDTGKAALEGFHDVPGTRIAVFYPDGGVSDVQRMQMVTQEGGNVLVSAVKGNFDDCQTGVKQIFASDHQDHWAAEKSARLSSANSINLGRLAPQIAYYFKAYNDLVLTGSIALGEKVHFVVPTGNFGDILAGEFARRMGLPVDRFICASNANNVLTDFIRTGTYDRRREFFKTISPSMDILISSNLERYLYLLTEGNVEQVAAWMKELNENGVYTVDQERCVVMQEHFSGYCADDDMAKEAIARVYSEYNYLMDPHTAVAWSALEQYRQETDDSTVAVVLSTASPYKFCRDVLSALTDQVPEDGFAAMDRLHDLTGVPVPNGLKTLREKEVRFPGSIEKDDMRGFIEGSL